MAPRTLEWFDNLGRGLLWAAVAVLGLSIITAISIAGSESTIPGIDEIQRQNRGVIAVASIGTGLTASGVLAGLGALVRLKVAEHRRSADA